MKHLTPCVQEYVIENGNSREDFSIELGVTHNT